MGVISFWATQFAITALTLGSLKKYGVIQLTPSAIKNDTLRSIFVGSVGLGEQTTEFLQSTWASIVDKIKAVLGTGKRSFSWPHMDMVE